jgi:hypothetical protein
MNHSNNYTQAHFLKSLIEIQKSRIYTKGPYNEISEIYDSYVQIPYVNFKTDPQTRDSK